MNVNDVVDKLVRGEIVRIPSHDLHVVEMALNMRPGKYMIEVEIEGRHATLKPEPVAQPEPTITLTLADAEVILDLIDSQHVKDLVGYDSTELEALINRLDDKISAAKSTQ